jgi:hypothetical protein
VDAFVKRRPLQQAVNGQESHQSKRETFTGLVAATTTAVAYLRGLNEPSAITKAEEILLNLNGDNKEEEETGDIAEVLDLHGDSTWKQRRSRWLVW